jgi:hypothetical protein
VLLADVFSTPGNSKHDTLTPGAKSTVNFSDGTVLDITLGGDVYNGVSTSYTGLVPTVTFELITDPSGGAEFRWRVAPFPEPLTISLFSVGLAGGDGPPPAQKATPRLKGDQGRKSGAYGRRLC